MHIKSFDTGCMTCIQWKWTGSDNNTLHILGSIELFVHMMSSSRVGAVDGPHTIVKLCATHLNFENFIYATF
jgi:hypothetical protein